MAVPWRRLRTLDRQELTSVVVAVGACVLILLFLILAGQVMEGRTRAFDATILLAFRRPSDLAKPIGPKWLLTAMLDVTALGGSTVLGLIVAAVVGFLCLQARYRAAMVIAVTSISGELLNQVMKDRFLRPRPDVVPYLREVASSSFPSGHAMESAIIYLTLGAMLMRIAERRATKIYCLAWALFLTLLVGLSRIYLGVHYPTDVVAGWIMGFVWASICWLVAQRFEAKTGAVEDERERAK